MTHTLPTSEEMLASPVFRALNAMIDEKAAMVAWNLAIIADPGKPQYPPSLRVRTHEEGVAGANVEIELPPIHAQLDRIAACIADVKALEKEILDLQRFKLRLLGDWDFTRGDNSLALLVFNGIVQSASNAESEEPATA